MFRTRPTIPLDGRLPPARGYFRILNLLPVSAIAEAEHKFGPMLNSLRAAVAFRDSHSNNSGAKGTL